MQYGMESHCRGDGQDEQSDDTPRTAFQLDVLVKSLWSFLRNKNDMIKAGTK